MNKSFFTTLPWQKSLMVSLFFITAIYKIILISYFNLDNWSNFEDILIILGYIYILLFSKEGNKFYWLLNTNKKLTLLVSIVILTSIAQISLILDYYMTYDLKYLENIRPSILEYLFNSYFTISDCMKSEIPVPSVVELPSNQTMEGPQPPIDSWSTNENLYLARKVISSTAITAGAVASFQAVAPKVAATPVGKIAIVAMGAVVGLDHFSESVIPNE